MAWWGRLIGGAFGAMVGGPIGAALGFVAGGMYDRRKSQGEFTDNERRQTTFYAATFSVLGYISKVDGYVSPEEIQFAEHVMRQMSLNSDQRKVAIELFRAGKEDDFELEPVLQQFAHECGNRRSIKRVFVEILITGAMADGGLDEIEYEELEYIAEVLGFNKNQFKEILETLTSDDDEPVSGRTRISLAEDYKMLGLSEGASRDEIKKAYRRKMSQYHPDKLVSKGLPEEMIQIATERTKQFRAAYERIQENLKSRKPVH